jgi:xanthine dehydrogenase accessory factor
MAGVFDIAPTVLRWLTDGESVMVGRVVAATGLAGRDAAGVAAWMGPGSGPVAVAIADMDFGRPGGRNAPIGSPLAIRARGSVGRVEVSVTDDDAPGLGLSCGGSATVLVQRATDLPQLFWSALQRGEPVGLIDAADGTTSAFDADSVPERFGRLFRRGVSQVSEIDGETVTTYWPRTAVLVVGGGPVASALMAQTDLLGWRAVVAEDLPTALDLLVGLGGADAVVVLSHDREVDGPLLRAAISSPVGYVGAMGSRHTQQARADWFVEHGVTVGLDRIHGPAGLDIGGFGPAEIALSIVAEIVAERSGKTD